METPFFVLISLSDVPCGFSQTFTLLKDSFDLPGPSMAFDESLSDAGAFLKFEFKTFVTRALVLYQDDEEQSDYIVVTLQDGRIHLTYKSAWDISKYTSEETYNDFRWHSMKIELDRLTTEITFTIDDKYASTRTYGRKTPFRSKLQIGGFSPQRAENTNEISARKAWLIYANRTGRGFFNACVRNIKYGRNGVTAHTIHDIPSYRHHVTSGCSLSYCHKPEPICKNHGRCKARAGETTVKCDCRWTGYEGTYCTTRALELTLNGTYSITYSWLGHIGPKHENYTFRIKTEQENARILIAKNKNKKIYDFLLFEIRNSKLVVRSNPGGDKVDDVLTTTDIISDNKWHLIEYKKVVKQLTLRVDRNKETMHKTRSHRTDYVRMDYNNEVVIGEEGNPYKHELKIQDFIWEGGKRETNFISGLYDSYSGPNQHYSITPRNVLPKFNRKLPKIPHIQPPTRSTITAKCHPSNEIQCETTSDPTTSSTKNIGLPVARTNDDDDDDDSSVTWIVVGTVLCALLLFAIIAFLVHKWNKRYSGDFQVNRKEIGPSATVVHYKDPCHKEKQRLAKI